MDRQGLLERQKEIKAQFDEVRATADAKTEEIRALEDELKRLQGRYAELEELLNAQPAATDEVKPAVKVPLDVTEKEQEDGKS